MRAHTNAIAAIASALVGCVALTATSASAQRLEAAGQGPGSLDIERFRPALDKGGIVDVDGAVVEAGALDAGLVVGLTLNPLGAVVDGRAFPIVQQRVGAHIVGSFALSDSFALGLEVPVVAFQSGPAFVPGVAGKSPVAAFGLDDIRVTPKLELLDGLAFAAHVTLPTSLPRHQYIGDGLPTIEPELDASATVLGRLRVAANGGAKLRAPSTFGAAVQGQELTWRAGAAYGFHDLVGLPVELAATANGAVLVFPTPLSANNNPIEGLVALGVDVGAVHVFAGAGTALLAGPGTPSLRALAGVTWSPRCSDDDGDGVCADADRCPGQAEDKDGVEDSDGCPDPDVPPVTTTTTTTEPKPAELEKPAAPPAPTDGDGDGVFDNDDKCPAEPETKNGFNDLDGCADVTLVPGDKLPLPSKINFEKATTKLTPDAEKALDVAVKLLVEHTEITLVRIEAHTESSDTAAGFQRNLALSKKQAEAVKAYLVKMGIDAKRIEMKGFGGARPVDTNATEDGRENNRRVDIVVEK